jgi:predicted transcriptional regulator of viral defense system
MPADRQALRRRLAALAATQSGYFSAAQGLAVGYSYQAQKFHADRGNWLRVERGLFRLPEWPVGEHDDLVRWSLWARGKAVVSHDTALAVHDLGEANPATVHLTVPKNFRSTARGVVLHRGVVEAHDAWEHEGFRITSPLRTLLDVAASNLDVDQVASALRDACAKDPILHQMIRVRARDLSPPAARRLDQALRIATPA